MRFFIAGFTLLALLGCGPSGPDGDAGEDASCTLDVTLGTGGEAGFVPLSDGDSTELVLGFQGIRMLFFSVMIDGAEAANADMSAFLTIEATGVELSRRTRESNVVATGDNAFMLPDYLVFFNDEPASEVVGQEAVLELVARVGDCVGGTRHTIMLRDDDECVDPDASVPDAGIVDGGVPDGAVTCGVTP